MHVQGWPCYSLFCCGPERLISHLHARRFGPTSSSYGTSDGSGFSGFHDSATSMASGGRARTRKPAGKELSNGHGGQQASSGSTHSSGRSRGSVASIGSHAGIIEIDPHLADAGAAAHPGSCGVVGLPPNGMPALLEDMPIADSLAQRVIASSPPPRYHPPLRATSAMSSQGPCAPAWDAMTALAGQHSQD